MNTTGRRQDRGQVQAAVRAGRERSWLSVWAAGLMTITVLATLLPARISYSADGDAAKQMHEITWLHESPNDVGSFVLFVSPVSGSMAEARQIDVGKPGGSGSGSAQFFSALVPIASDEFVAVAAIGRNGLLSSLSAWSRPQPSQPGQPLVVQP